VQMWEILSIIRRHILPPSSEKRRESLCFKFTYERVGVGAEFRASLIFDWKTSTIIQMTVLRAVERIAIPYTV
jgi:hypothetical protein